MKKQLKWKREHANAVIPTIAHEGDSGFDLYAIESAIILPGETKMIKTGLSVELPEHTEMEIRPRSGMALKTPYIIKNSPGTVDEPYRGPLNVIVHCLWTAEYKVNGELVVGEDGYIENSEIIELVDTGKPVVINAGDRIAQGCIKPTINHEIEFVESDKLTKTERGKNGFGSSGGFGGLTTEE